MANKIYSKGLIDHLVEEMDYARLWAALAKPDPYEVEVLVQAGQGLEIGSKIEVTCGGKSYLATIVGIKDPRLSIYVIEMPDEFYQQQRIDRV